MALELILLPVTALQQNCRILVDSSSGEAIVVDPGGDAAQIGETLATAGVNLSSIWLTHSHLDHCGGVADLLSHSQVPLYGHPGEAEFRNRVEEVSAMYGIPAGQMKNCPEPDHPLTGGENLSFGGRDFEVRFTPGHSPGHLVFFCAEEGFLLAGDTLFAGSIGRTDLPGGNHEQLLDSISQQIYSLPDETRVLSGHGPDTTVGVEKRSNPFVRASE